MGIPHLIATLQPFAEQLVLENEKVVIDGPALAYHILQVCRAHGLLRPSEKVLGQTLIRWLDELEENGVIIQHVYFDGHLPLSKQSVRMERLVKSHCRVDDYFTTNPRGCPIAQTNSEEQTTDLDVFELANTPAIKPPPDPSFLVPSVIDALRNSPRFRSLFSVVPGEADAYCARHVARHGGMVMTSDSDLLAHDLGSGKVVFLRDIHRNASGGLSYSAFYPQDIYQRLSLPAHIEPWRFAFERKRSQNATLSYLVKACSLPIVDTLDYDHFRRQYLHPEDGSLLLSDNNGKNKLQINGLDPRISELILQIKQAIPDPKIYLPIMIESPLKGTVWEPSMPTRRLAYTIAGWMMDCSSSPSVYEYRRVRQRDQKGRQVDLMPLDAISGTVSNLVSFIKHVRGKIVGNAKHDGWIYLVIVLDVMGCEGQGKKSHLLEMLRKGYTPPPRLGDRLPWDISHFAAQIQAGLYSVRILSQTLSVTAKLDESGDAFPKNDLQKLLRQLRQLLLQFPALNRFPQALDSLQFLEAARRDKALGMIHSLANVADSSPPEMVDEASRAKKPTTGKTSGHDARPSRPAQVPASQRNTKTNMFSLLSIDK